MFPASILSLTLNSLLNLNPTCFFTFNLQTVTQLARFNTNVNLPVKPFLTPLAQMKQLTTPPLVL